MSDEEFLSRWSRRKREAKAVPDAPPPAQPVATPNPDPAVTAESPAADEVDLSSLPSIDSITALTDVTAFLRKGIPPELTRAALRRAWAADPAIRDFVGLAENAWDFNDPNAMPGFGPLDCSEEQLSALIDRIAGSVRNAVDRVTTAVGEPLDSNRTAESAPEPPAASSAPEAVADVRAAEEISRTDSSAAPAATQPDLSPSEANATAPLRRRTHGSALPR
jgi:hypothetical protein